MRAPPRILALHAHPDDIEFQCAGLLCHARDQGAEIIMATMTAGDCGSAELPAAAIAGMRRREAQAAADLIQAEYVCLEFEDLRIIFDNDSRRRVTEAVRAARPDVVITAPPADYMPDHEITSLLARDACFNASVPNYATNATPPAPSLPRPPILIYCDPLEGKDAFGRPAACDFHINVTSVFDRKAAMLACHASQRDWLRRQHDVDEYLESQRRWSARRGAEVGVAFAEGFRVHGGHAFPSAAPFMDWVAKWLHRRSASAV